MASTLSYIVVQRCYNFLISYLADLYFYIGVRRNRTDEMYCEVVQRKLRFSFASYARLNNFITFLVFSFNDPPLITVIVLYNSPIPDI